MDIIESFVRGIVELGWNIPWSLWLLIRRPKAGPRLLLRRLADSTIPQVGPNTLLCVCFAPFSQTLNFEFLLGLNVQPSLKEWIAAAIRGLGKTDTLPYGVVESLVFGIGMTMLIDIIGRLAYRSLPTRILEPAIIKLKYFFCVPALSAGVFTWLFWYAPFLVVERLNLSGWTAVAAVFFAWLSLVIVFGFALIWLRASKMTRRQERWAELAPAMMVIFPFIGLVDYLTTNGIGNPSKDFEIAREVDQYRTFPWMYRNETVCRYEGGMFTADVVFHNPYEMSLSVGGGAIATITLSGNVPNYLKIPAFELQRADATDMSPNRIVLAPHSDLAVRLKRARDKPLPKEIGSLNPGVGFRCHIKGSDALTRRQLLEDGWSDGWGSDGGVWEAYGQGFTR